MKYKLSTTLTTALFIFSLSVTFSQTIVEGTVKNNNKEALREAIVRIKGSSVYSVADSMRHFNLTTPSKLPFSLVISLVGHRSKELNIQELTAVPLQIILNTENCYMRVNTKFETKI